MSNDPLAKFVHWFASIAAEWNHCERTAQYILAELLGATATAHAVCCELKNVQLTNALNVAAELSEPDVKVAIKRFCESFERMRVYRNFVIHGIQELPTETSARGAGIATLGTESGKGAFKTGTQNVNAGDLEAVSKTIQLTTRFGSQIYQSLTTGSPQPSPDTLPLPTRMAKNSRSHPMLQPQPESSGA